MVTRRELDIGLNQLQDMLVDMGKKVEKALGEAMAALSNLDAQAARKVVEADPELNRIEEQISEVGARLIATQQPVATDLRRVLAALRIASDLERMGDLAVDVAKAAIRMEGQTLIKPLIDLPLMAEMVQEMISDSIRSFLEENVDLAYKMAKDDDQVDELFGKIFRELAGMMAEDPKVINQSMLLLFVARYIERIADHATNIGESVVYLVTSKRPDLN
ncbi:phosphate signaling complex protein PhoU [Cohnella pontilimi]|uniref:Phosphate-specific transport system accessory protein PhoU n=1 Tax=Cohnella pontilimi TaxID=2564100 RepID=A0A4U0F9C9_9BACL|nr:phosphate signaling complex protein PhoU [Cohnella pontilimi]TJY39702.1 phosphate signaling complex protein PhoU [Cohnella pontilimi]